MKPLIVSILVVLLASPSFATIYYVTDEYFGTKTIRNGDSLIMTGGGGDVLTAKDYSVLDIRNTSSLSPYPGGIVNLIVTENSQLKLSGGHISNLDIGNYATAVLSGGQINQITSGYSYASLEHIKVICQSASYNSTTKYLTGIWKDGSDFSIKFVDRTGYSSVISNVTIIPEPASLLLLGLGGLLLRRKPR